jgi:signal transduction histidine kinase/CheY-like chemotaxis protein
MREVASKVFHIFFRPLVAKGVALESMVEGTSVSLASLQRRNERIDWSDLCAIHRNLRSHFTDEDLVEVGRSYLRSRGLRYAFVIGRVLLTPMGFYRFMNKPRAGAGNQMFTCVVSQHREISDTECEAELTLPEGYEVCWDFFLLTKGCLEEIPRLLGYPAANVELERIPHGGRYHITIRQRTRLVTRILRTLTWPFTVRAAARELRDAHETLIERYHEIEDAKAQLDRQATQLRTAHTINDLVQRDLDLVRTLDTVARALVEQAGFVWAEIQLHPTDPEAAAAARTVRFGGDGDHEPPLTRALEVQGQRIGELEVAPRTGANRAEREELLAFIAPTLAMALQNALSYQALADYRSGLERLVDQRTGELRQARDQLAGTVVELREAQGARERFFGNVTHEIRTPLSLILLAAADIDRRAGHLLDERARKNLGAVTDGAHKLVRLVDELLLLAAGQEDKLRTNPERTDLGALLGAVVAAWQPAAEAAGLTLTGPAIESLIASVDPIAIERVASNLVSNAVKYTPRGGSINVELADEPDGLRFSVLDTGIGMSEDLQKRLFGRFERDQPGRHRAAGTGLGLSVAKQLVEAHGGTISALPRATGSGSELRVVLPPGAVIRDSEPRPVTVARLGLAPTPSNGEQPVTLLKPSGVSAGTILLAEDDVRLAEVIASGLADEYTVVVAHDGTTALELVHQHQPQMLITDVDMPGINGIELSRRFRELTGDRLAPIIVLSAMLDLGTRMAGLEAGAVDYVTKPFDPLELRARIRSQFRMRDQRHRQRGRAARRPAAARDRASRDRGRPAARRADQLRRADRIPVAPAARVPQGRGRSGSAVGAGARVDPAHRVAHPRTRRRPPDRHVVRGRGQVRAAAADTGADEPSGKCDLCRGLRRLGPGPDHRRQRTALHRAVRQRGWCPRPAARARVRAVLHDQADGDRDRARSAAGSRHRSSARRRAGDPGSGCPNLFRNGAS